MLVKGLPLTLRLVAEEWPLNRPFLIAGYEFRTAGTLLVELSAKGRTGRGEASGIYYKGETVQVMMATLESWRTRIEQGLSHASIGSLTPCGARNALDCAFWDLRAKLEGTPAWSLAGLQAPKSLSTTFTCGICDPQEVAVRLQEMAPDAAIKLKLAGDGADGERVAVARAASPATWLGVDGNQSLDPSLLRELMPALEAAGVAMLEQPFPVGKEEWLAEFRGRLPLVADESFQGFADLDLAASQFDGINIKLDKCGGLTEALAIRREAERRGIACMAGNMLGTSLAMAPAFLAGQGCQIVDLDGPFLLADDREHPVQYAEGGLDCPTALWGYPDPR